MRWMFTYLYNCIRKQDQDESDNAVGREPVKPECHAQDYVYKLTFIHTHKRKCNQINWNQNSVLDLINIYCLNNM